MHNKSLLSRVYEYNGSFVTFDKTNDATMVNATQMAKPFKKLVADWTRQKSTEEFLSALSTVRGIPISALIQTIKGGNSAQGTWMHEDVALEFARWLSPQFAIWCNDRIKELFKEGVVKAQRTEERRKLLAVEKETPHPAKGKTTHYSDGERAKKNLVFVKYGTPVTSTLAIARTLGRGHGSVLDSVRNLLDGMDGVTTSSYKFPTSNKSGIVGWQNKPLYLLTRKALTHFILRTRRIKDKERAFAPILDAFDRAEADIAKNKASGAQPQPLPPTPPTPTPPVTAAATPTQGDMAERMIAAMAVLTGADIKKVQDIMRKGGAL